MKLFFHIHVHTLKITKKKKTIKNYKKIDTLEQKNTTKTKKKKN